MDKPLVAQPGFYELTADQYFADPCPTAALSNSLIGLLLDRSPAHAARQHPLLNQTRKERQATAAMYRGSVVHRLALGAGKDFVAINADDYRTKAAKEARDEAEANGLVPILESKLEEAREQAETARRHLDDLLMGESFEPEIVIAWQEDTPFGPIWCRGMIDAWCPSLRKVVDLKSTVDASEEAVRRRMANGGYDTQAAFYQRGVERIGGQGWFGTVSFVTLFCETDPPFESQPFHISEGWATAAWDRCEMAIERWGKCLSTGEWPGYRRSSTRLEPPAWLVGKQLSDRFNLEAA
jgi:hypothetical protein